MGLFHILIFLTKRFMLRIRFVSTIVELFSWRIKSFVSLLVKLGVLKIILNPFKRLLIYDQRLDPSLVIIVLYALMEGRRDYQCSDPSLLMHWWKQKIIVFVDVRQCRKIPNSCINIPGTMLNVDSGSIECDSLGSIWHIQYNIRAYYVLYSLTADLLAKRWYAKFASSLDGSEGRIRCLVRWFSDLYQERFRVY